MVDQELELLHIFNRNIAKGEKYVEEDIRKAFLKADISLATKKEKLIIQKFFKECPDEKYINELKKYGVSIQKIKRLYQSFSIEKKIDFGSFWSSRFRLPKILGKITPRDNPKYLEIENFKKYELTPCIAYEMAIRNKKVQMLFERYNLITGMYNNKKFIYKRFFTKDNFNNVKNHPTLVLSKEYESYTYEEYEAVIMKKLHTYKQLIEKNYKNFIDEYINKCTELSINELMLLQEKIEDELINDYLIYPKGYRRKVPGAKDWYKEEITNSKKKKGKKAIDKDTKDQGCQIRFEEIIHDTFIQIQGTHIQHNEYFVNNILPNFHRQVNDQNQINIPINFSLPLEEIIEYITKVKKHINPKTPLELLGEKLYKANNLENITIENDKTVFDITRGNAQKKFADMFYIYDMKQKGFTYSDIIHAINDARISVNNTETSISEKTIQKYFKIAKMYIEKEKYKELVTGKITKLQ